MKKTKAILSVFLQIILLSSCQKNGDSFEKYVMKDFDVPSLLSEGNGQKIDVIFLSGQSNATGVAKNSILKDKISIEEYSEYENGYENILINYYIDNKINSSKGQFLPTKLGMGANSEYYGPELGMAQTLNKNEKKVIILKYTFSGTTLRDQWLDVSKKDNAGPIYKAFKKFMSMSLEYIKEKNYDVDVKAICWMQGENDATNLGYANAYMDSLLKFSELIRKDFKSYTKDEIAFIDAGILQNKKVWSHSDVVNNEKYKFSEMNSNNIYIDTNAYLLHTDEEPYDNPDVAHYDTLSTLKLGELFANELLKII